MAGDAQAEQSFTQAIRLDPDNADFHAWLGRVYSNREEKGKALAEVDRALQLDSSCAMAYCVRAREQKDLDRASQDYTRAIELDPRLALAYNNRGNAFSKKWRLRARHPR